ncbi:MAG: phosphate acyltransferase PlsX [Elusimicrobiota bacterium]|nr:MAG: phosphate acyltransferase PlsX [Elusimicrobiota bacterium]
MRIALDAVGGDFGLTPNIEGAIQAANAFGVELLLAGPADKIRAELSARGIAPGDSRFDIVDAPDTVGMDEEPASACRSKPNSSIMAAARAAAEGKAAGFVSAGNSGATMCAALFSFKRVPGILRPAIACPIPTAKGVTILLDAGANMDCKPWHLVQFGQMGALLARHVYGISEPTVGLLTIGEEEGKGNDLAKEAFPLLKSSGVNFFGCVEGRDVPAGKVDVVVCDGFVGNVLIKTMEGTAMAMMAQLKGELMSSWRYKIATLALRGPLSRLKRKMSYDEYGGAPLVGVNGVAIVSHGSSNARAIANALRVAAKTAEAGVPKVLKEVVARAAAPEERVEI